MVTLAGRLLDAQYIETLDEMERQHILKAIKMCDGNITKAARLIGIARATLYRKLKQYEINQSVIA